MKTYMYRGQVADGLDREVEHLSKRQVYRDDTSSDKVRHERVEGNQCQIDIFL